MILSVAEAANPPRGIRPRTLRAALAIAVEALQPGQRVELGGIITLSGAHAPLNTIKGSLPRATAPGRTHSFRILPGGKFQIWRNT